MTAINLDYVARPQFIPFHKRGQRNGVLVCHRQAGKTTACVHDTIDACLRATTTGPRFAYIAPYRNQAKGVAWDYFKRASLPLVPLGATFNEAELRIDYPNGGRITLVGSDDPNALRGRTLDGVVLDEFADMDPAITQVISPTLIVRRGWLTYIGTPRGHNQFYDIWRKATLEQPEDWFSLMLKASETGMLGAEELESERKRLSEEEYAQEYECSFEASIKGAYYGKLMAAAEADGRITGVAYEPTAQVWTAWDLGIRDATAIWFAQTVGREIHIIDYYESSGVDLGHYVHILQQKPYLYAGHIVPHDAQAKELGTGKTRLEVLESLGLKHVSVAPMHRVEDGINGVRVFIPKCWFDAKKCARGIDALKLYRAEYSDKLQALKASPVHDWTSHAADAFRYLAMTKIDPPRKHKIQYPALGIV